MTEKVVLITGTSRGIGKAIAAYLRAQGLTVYGSSRGAADVGPYHLQLDITDSVSCQNAVDEVVKREGRHARFAQATQRLDPEYFVYRFGCRLDL
jgi:NAD(P)-dependent dehydrogenase (short-subunit alcohol dehydrogenase family)